MRLTAANRWLFLVSGALAAAIACSNGVPLGPANPSASQPAAAAPTVPTATTPTPAVPTPAPTTTSVAYSDLQPAFATDCVPCHGSRSPAGRYSMTSYAAVLAAVHPGSASSALVIVTQPGGVMYSFLSGDRAAKSAMIRSWVLNGAPQNR